jgi:large subunit ribosomal protein L10
MATKEKEMLVGELTEKLKNNQGVVLTEYQGLTVAEISELRAKLRAQKCEYKVIKNTLSKIALKNAGFEEFSKMFEGPTAVAIQNGDPVTSAKVLVDFSKDHAKLKIMAGLLGNKILAAAEVKALAALPSRNVLIAKMLGSMNAPITGLVNVMQANIRNIVYVLDAVRKQKAVQQ